MLKIRNSIFVIAFLCVSCTLSVGKEQIKEKAIAGNSQMLKTLQQKVEKLSKKVKMLEENNSQLKEKLTNMQSTY